MLGNIAILGTNFGDEAKARCANYFSRKGYNFTVRPHSGASAGHTIYENGKKIVRHLIPSTDFSIAENKAFMASGMVIELEEFLKEVLETEKIYPGAAKRIYVDPDAFVVLPKHIEEDKRVNGHIGSTNKGITPAYKDKIGRTGVKIRSYINDNANIIKALKDLGIQFKYLLECKEELEKSKVVFEGSQSILLDLNFADYPYCTSAECGLGGIYNSGLAFIAPKKIIGVSKGGFWTKSGGGNSTFPTEMLEKDAEYWREKAGEYGATTGRPRRIGFMDLPLLKYAIIKSGVNTLVLTKLDILNGQEQIKVCCDYDKSIYSGNDFVDAKPQYTILPGWNEARDVNQVMPFVEYIESYTKTPVEYISVGVNDEDMICIADVARSNNKKGTQQ